MANTKIESSNLECRVSNTVYFTSNMQYSWEIADYKQKLRIQNFIYPEGIRFSKQKMAVRTLKINKLILYLSRFNNDLQSSNLTDKLSSEEMSHLVELQGFEPWSGVGDDGAFYMFIDDYCRDKIGSSKPKSYPYAAW